MVQFFTAGESHGKGLIVLIEGMPAHVPISIDLIRDEMQKRKTGLGSGGRQYIEDDEVEVISGIRFGKTIGSPISLLIPNRDASNWGNKMSVSQQDSAFQESIAVTNPRPGHADLAGAVKYGFTDVRNVLERASARETAARVAAGAIFKQFLRPLGIEIASHTIRIGHVEIDTPYTFQTIRDVYAEDPETRCVDPQARVEMKQLIDRCRKAMNTLGGVVETWAEGVPVGLGSYVQHDRKIDSQLAGALMSIQSVKAVEIGMGISSATEYGSRVHDEIFFGSDQGYFRTTNSAGGVEGGVTNGMPLVVRVYHKPISTLYRPLQTVDIKTKEKRTATVERSDICVVPRAGVVSESMVAYVLTKNILEKFGGDNFDQISASLADYKRTYSS